MLVDRSIQFSAELKNWECGYKCFGMVRTLYTRAIHNSLVLLLHNEGGATTRYR